MSRQYVGIDLHRRSTTVYRMTQDGELLGCVRIPSQPFELAQELAKAGPEPEVVLESTYGWYWAADVMQEMGAHVHLAHALGNNWGNRRVKNDERDAKDLAAMLRLGRLAEGWIAPAEVRELRELVRYRYSLVRHRTSAKAQIHGVMAKNGILPVVAEMWGPAGDAQLDRLELPLAYQMRIESLRGLVARYDAEIAVLDRRIHHELRDDPGYKAIQSACGCCPKALDPRLLRAPRRRGALSQMRIPTEFGHLYRSNPDSVPIESGHRSDDSGRAVVDPEDPPLS
jgi:transposase